MKVAFDVSYLQKNRAGHGRYTLVLLEAMLAQPTDIRFVLHGWSYSLDQEEIRRLRNSQVSTRVSRIPGPVKRFYWNQARWPPVEYLAGEFDIFHSVDSLLPPTRKKKIASVHDLAYKLFPHFFEQRVLRWDKFVRRSVTSADAIIVPSQKTRDDLQSVFGIPDERIRVIRYPVGGMFKSGPDHRDEEVRARLGLGLRFALFVGTVEPRKNLPHLLEAFARLHAKKHLDIDLVIAGKKGWLYHEALAAMERSPVRSRIRYLDYVAESDLASLYRLATFFIYPSMYEGFGFPVTEAMATGTPVITSNTSSLKEIAEGAALLVDPSSVEELTDAMERLANDEGLRHDLSARGLRRAAQFSSHGAAQEVMALYRELV